MPRDLAHEAEIGLDALLRRRRRLAPRV